MKSLVLSLFAIVFVVVLSSDSAYPANGTAAAFEQRKADQIKRIDILIKQLEDEKACIARTTNREASKMCRERARPAQKSGPL